MRAALGDTDFSNGMAAAQAGQALAVVDKKMLLRTAACAIRFAVPVHTGPFVVDGFAQDGLHAFMQRAGLLFAQVSRAAQWVQPGPEQGLIRVDIAHPGDKGLVHQQNLDGPAAPSDALVENSGRKTCAQRLRPQPPQHTGRVGGQVNAAETPRIGKAKLLAVIQVGPPAQPAVGLQHSARAGHIQAAGHAQVYNQRIVIELHHDILTPAAERADALPGDACGKFIRVQAFNDLCTLVTNLPDYAPVQCRIQPTDNGFNFW